MKCSDCGIEMNHHASKVIEPRTPEEAEAVDEDLGGVLVSFHTCPECGHGAAESSASGA